CELCAQSLKIYSQQILSPRAHSRTVRTPVRMRRREGLTTTVPAVHTPARALPPCLSLHPLPPAPAASLRTAPPPLPVCVRAVSLQVASAPPRACAHAATLQVAPRCRSAPY